MKLLEIIKEVYSKLKIELISFSLAIAGLISAYNLLYNYIQLFIPGPYILITVSFIIYLIILVFIFRVCNVIINSKEERIFKSNNDLGFKYEEKYRKTAKFLRFAPLLILIPFVWRAFSIHRKVNDYCNEIKNNFGIFIANFSIDTNPEDLLSRQLVVYVKSNLDNPYYKYNLVNRYCSTSYYLTPEDSILPLMGCFKKGIFVFGTRNKDENFLDCKIFLLNPIDSTNVDSKNIMTISEPNSLEFTIKAQTAYLGDFILSLLLYHQKEYTKTIEMLDKIQLSYGSKIENKFKGMCYLLRGNSFYMMNDYDSAKSSYTDGLKFDKDSVLKGNLSKVLKIIQPVDTEKGIKIQQESSSNITKPKAPTPVGKFPKVDSSYKLEITEAFDASGNKTFILRDNYKKFYPFEVEGQIFRYNDHACTHLTSDGWECLVLTEMGVKRIHGYFENQFSAIIALDDFFSNGGIVRPNK